MDTNVFLLNEIIVLGLFSLGIILGLIYHGFKEKKISSFFIGILGILLVDGFPIWGLYINLNRYCSIPEPTNVIEANIEGEPYVVYQDITHLCQPSNNKSSYFTGRIPIDAEVTQMDLCTICRRRFIDHYTRREYKYYETIAAMNESFQY